MALSLEELRTLDRLLQQALDLPEGERAAWVDALPDEHARLVPILREHLHESDAAEGVEAGAFLSALPRLAPDRPGGGAAGSPHDPQAGERIGPYRLVRPLGMGGMGSVWLAERADGALSREVALKLPHRHLMAHGLAERMARERDILAGLNHDHIARLYDAGVDDHGRPFLALEYVVGTPVNEFCEAHAVDLEGRVRLAVQVVRAVAHAHANLVVHRDLKPGNILVTTPDGAASVKLLDFGIGKILADEEDPEATHDLTRVMGRALTPDYASPEQILEQPVTTATDIYSLGVVLYQVIAGEKPYALRRQASHDLVESILAADIALPSRRAAGGRYRGEAKRIAGDLDAIVLKAMRPEPEARYATASALADDLERFLAHQPVLAQPDRWAYRARRFVRRNRVAVTAGSAAALALLLGTGVALWQARQARLEAAKTKAVQEFLVSLFTAGGVGQENAAIRRKQPVGDVLMEAARTLPATLDDQPEVKSELQQTLGGLLEDMLLSEVAAGLRADRLRDLEARGAPLAERMQARAELAQSLGGTGDKKQALSLLDQVIAALEGRDDTASRSVLSHAFTSRAMLRNIVAGGQGSLDDARRAVAITEQDEPGSAAHVYTLIALGAAHAWNGKLAEAEAAFGVALPLAAKLPGKDAAVEATVHSHLARSFFQYRHYPRAEDHAKRALAVIERFAGKDSFVWARNAIYPGIVAGLRGEAGQAIAYLEQAVKVFAAMKSDIDPEFASFTRTLLAQVLLDGGRIAEARDLAEAAWAPYRTATGEGGNPAPILRAATMLAQVLQAQGELARAGELLARAVSLGGPPTPNLLAARRVLAINEARLGRHEEARSLLAGIIEGDPSPGERFGAQRHLARIALAEVLLLGGRLDEAAKELEAIGAQLASLRPDERETAVAAAAQVARLTATLDRKRGNAAPASRRLVGISR